MSTVDLTKVAGFKAVDAEGNDMGVVSLSEMTNMVKESIIQEAVAMQSVSTLAEASTLAATDTYEDKLDISDTFSYVRTLDSSGNPKRTSSNAFASVVGGLLSNKDFANVIGALIGFSKKVGTVGLYGGFKDFNECNNPGYYTIAGGNDSSIANKCDIEYGLLFYIKGNDNGSYSLQIAFDMFNRKIVYRMTNTSVTWERWVRIVGELV